MPTRVKGLLSAMLSAACYGCSPVLALGLYALNFDAANALFYRYFIAALMMLPILALKKETLTISMADLKALAFPGIFFALSTLTYFVSFNYMNAGISATILFLYPIFTALIMVFAYHEKISWFMILAMILSLAGVILLHHAEVGGLSLIGTLLAIASALTYALYIVGINRTHLLISNEKLTFYLILFSIAITGIYMLCSPTSAIAIPDEPLEYLFLCLLALVPTIISLELLNVAIAGIGTTLTAILGALEPLTAVALSVLFFDEDISFNLAMGIGLIVGGVLIVIGGERFKARRARVFVKRFNFIIRKTVRRRWRWKS